MTSFDLPPFRDYQAHAHDRVRRAVGELRRAKPGGGCGVLIQGPTGSGKTRQALGFVEGAVRKGNDVVILAPREELVDQPVEKLWEYGVRSIRVIKRGQVTGDPTARITVASIQTLVARGFAPDARLVILDEARHYVASEWGKIAGRYANAVRLGLDATPVRTDGAPLGDLFDRIVVTSTVAELQRDGFLVPCVTIAPDRSLKGLSQSPADAYREHIAGRRAIIFCQNVAHSREVARELCDAGFRFAHVDGTTEKSERRDALKALARGDLHGVTNCNLFLEGVDVPAVEGVIVARGCSSEAAWLQMGGRGTRPSPSTGKTRMWLIDLMGHMWRFGLLDEERTYHLDGKAIRRVSALPSIVQCKSCHAWGRGGAPCSGCGAALDPPKAPRITPAELREQRGREPEQRKRAALRVFVSRELSAGRNGWRAMHIYRGVYGDAPPRAWLIETLSELRAARERKAA